MNKRRKIAAAIFAALLGLGIGLSATSSEGTAHAAVPNTWYHQ